MWKKGDLEGVFCTFFTYLDICIFSLDSCVAVCLSLLDLAVAVSGFLIASSLPLIHLHLPNMLDCSFLLCSIVPSSALTQSYLPDLLDRIFLVCLFDRSCLVWLLDRSFLAFDSVALSWFARSFFARSLLPF